MEVTLVVVGGKQAGMEIPVAGPKFLIGRGHECRLRPQSHLVSRKHCAILVGVGSAAIEDFGSTNGTFLNGEKVEQRRDLKDGDRITVGQLELEVLLGAAGQKKHTKARHAKEAAAHKVAAGGGPDDELDISSWLEDDDHAAEVVSPPRKPTALHDTSHGKKVDETVAMPAERGTQDKETKPVKIVGQFQRATKPKAESSRAAADEMLKQFAPKKKP